MKNELEHVYFCFLALIWIIHLARILRLVSAWECVLYRADYGSWELSYTASVTWMSLIKKCPHCHCPGLNPVHLHGTLSGPVYKINTLRHTLLVLVIHFWLKSSVCQCEGLWLLSPVTPELRPSWRLMLSWPLGRWCTDQPQLQTGGLSDQASTAWFISTRCSNIPSDLEILDECVACFSKAL